MAGAIHPDNLPAIQQPEIRTGGVASRLWDGFRRLAVISELFKGLEKETARNQAQTLELSRIVLELSKEVRELSGMMKGIEKRLEDKDKLIEAVIKLRITEEMAKLHTH
jgi:hypothetical protein